ncbi:MAG: ComEC/Rec2 family competence protein [Candidatus Peribacteraceae bacterium]|nr:ComEC/Rec2 family competence protein [Candidatus Peribacteraceae bacterium]
MEHPERTAFTFLGSFLSTVFVLQWWQAVTYPRWLWFSIMLPLPYVLLIGRWRLPILAGLLGIAIAFGSVARETHRMTGQYADAFATGQTVTLRGMIADEPDRRAMETRYTLATKSITFASGLTRSVEGSVLVTDESGWPQLKYGDMIETRGSLTRPGSIESFRYDHYLSRYGIYAVMNRAKVQRISDGHGSPIFSLLYEIKERFELQITRLFHEPHASFLMGLLTGSRRGIPDTLQQAFQTTGLTHIIAISGYNITIILTILGAILFPLPRRIRFLMIVTGICIFTLFVGAGASVVRAAIMGILGLLAVHADRKPNARLLILWAAFFMLLWNPKCLWYDAGFQLSFLATIGLTELSPFITQYMKWMPATFGIRESLAMTLAAQIATAPLILFVFGRLSLIAPIANIFAAPAVPVAMLFGFLATVFSFVSFPLGQIFTLIGWLPLEWIISVAQALQHVPFASVGMTQGIIFLLFCIAIAADIIILTKYRRRSLPSI